MTDPSIDGLSPPVTAREALLIEAIGQMGRVLERAETLNLVIEASHRDATEAHDRLAGLVSTLEVRLAATGETVKKNAVSFIAQRTGHAARQSIELHLRAMQEAAGTLFVKELGPALQGLVQPLLRVQDVVRQHARPWDTWLTHAATAAAASACTWMVTTGGWRW